MTANAYVQKMLARRIAIQAAMDIDPPVLVHSSTHRPLLDASHAMNLLIDCDTTDATHQTDTTQVVPLKSVGAIARVSEFATRGTRMAIQKDPTQSIYLNLNACKAAKVVTLIELSQRNNIIDPLYIRGVSVIGFTPSYFDLDIASLKLNARYAVVMQNTSSSLPRCREFINSVDLMYKSGDKLSPLVSAFVNFTPGVPIRFPLAPDKFQKMGYKFAYTFNQSPPGSGKTWQLIQDATAIRKMRDEVCFIIAPTNEVVLEICKRLTGKGVTHNVALSDQGLHKLLDERYSNNMSVRQALKIANESDSKARHEHHTTSFVASSRAFSNLYVMTFNKYLTPKWEIRGLYSTSVLWDEATLSSTCSFFSALNKNPSFLIQYGDQEQGAPYAVHDRPDASGVLLSPVHTFKILDGPYHRLLRYHTRMPTAYSDFFLDFFYKKVPLKSVYTIDCEGVSRCFKIFGHNTSFKARHPHYTDPHYVRSSPKSYVGNFIPEGFFPADKFLVLTPYTAHASMISHSIYKDRIRVLTLRPAQGQQDDFVLLDMVKPNLTQFFTNCLMDVALSRFCNYMCLTFVPALPRYLLYPIAGYFYNEQAAVFANYQRFVKQYADNVEALKVSPAEGFDYTDLALYDHNGHFFLKWYFFLCVLEYVLCRVDALPYAKKFCAFGYIHYAQYMFDTLAGPHRETHLRGYYSDPPPLFPEAFPCPDGPAAT